MKTADGDCYVKHGKVFSGMDWGSKDLPIDKDAIRNGDIVIVHGAPTLRGGPYAGNKFGHCWLEDNEKAYDFSNGNEVVLDKRIYYALGNIDPEENVTYTIDEYRKKLVEEGTWGPWEGPAPEREWLTESSKFPIDDKSEIGQKDIPLSRKELEDLMGGDSLYESRKKNKEPLFQDYNDFFWTDEKNPPEHVVQPQKNDKGYAYMKKEWNKQHKKFDTGYFGQ